jgi:glutamine synthetase
MTALDPAALDTAGVDTVIVAAVDMQGRLFGRRFPLESFHRARDGEINVSSCNLARDIGQTDRLAVEYAGYHTGWHDLQLVPDIQTLRLTPWWPGVAVVMADIVETQTSERSKVAPRTILRKQIEALREAGYGAAIGGELEFYLFHTSYDDARETSYRRLTPSVPNREQDLISVRTGFLEDYFRELRRTLSDAGIEVRSNDAEWGRGQWELSLDHSDPLEAADRIVLSKVATKVVSAQYDMSATFMARPSGNDTGSSCHLNVSIQSPDGKPVFHSVADSNSMTQHMLHAIGGLLCRAPDLMLFYAPTVNSYRRSSSNQFAGHGLTWGFDNRTVTCRIVGRSPSSMRIEFRPPGADCNPYLAIAGVLASVRDGIVSQSVPPPPTTGNAYESDEEHNWLPKALDAAVAAFESSSFASETFGKDVIAQYGANGGFEWAEFMNHVTDWELSRYFESI